MIDVPCFFVLKAGIPDGVLNVVPGFGQTAGVAISLHMDIDKVTQMSSIWKLEVCYESYIDWME